VLIFKGSANLRRITVLNPKGGSGKTTLAFNLAGYLATTGRKVAVVDMDRQGSSTHWLHNRSSDLPEIVGISGKEQDFGATKTGCIVVPEDIEYAVIDAPAGLAGDRLIDFTCGAHAVLVPVLPSDLDIHAASRLISNLLLVAQVSRRNGRLGVVANRVNERTIAYRQLTRFLNRLSIAVVGILRDSQNYTRAAANGLSIHEMPPAQVRKDLEQWSAVTQWLENRLATPLTPRDQLRPIKKTVRRKRKRLWMAGPIPAAAAMAVVAVSMWLWSAVHVPRLDAPVDRVMAPEAVQAARHEAVVEQIPEEPPIVSARDELRQKWELSGIVQWGGPSLLILNDRDDQTTRRIRSGADLDGWVITETGPDYAVFAQNGEEVRLALQEKGVD
jgi:chromosome partitioning protein